MINHHWRSRSGSKNSMDTSFTGRQRAADERELSAGAGVQALYPGHRGPANRKERVSGAKYFASQAKGGGTPLLCVLLLRWRGFFGRGSGGCLSASRFRRRRSLSSASACDAEGGPSTIVGVCNGAAVAARSSTRLQTGHAERPTSADKRDKQ